MKTKILKFTLNFAKVYLFNGLVSLLLLIYLVISDPYFRELDFKLEGFKTKINEYLLFTFNIPVIVTIVFSVYLIIKSQNKLITLFSCLFGIAAFAFFDKLIKKALIYPSNVLLGLLIGAIIYAGLFVLVLRADNKVSISDDNV